MFCTDTQTIVARKEHQCTWCAQTIAKGESHRMWKSVGGSWFTNRMHPECADACNEECLEWHDNEYHPYDNERPTAADKSADTKGGTNGGPVAQ